MFTELVCPWYLITPKGRAVCLAIIDYGSQASLMFVCVQCETGEFWIWSQPDVRMEPNSTMGIQFREPQV